MRLPLSALVLGGLGLLQSSCAHDTVAPDAPEPVCGDGIIQDGEQCDLVSPGCVSCLVVPTWSCSQQAGTCTQQPGDGVMAGYQGSSPARSTACDMSGYWAARETSFARDSIVGSVQTASNWFLYHIEQSGNDFYIQEEIDCGIEVSGSAIVEYTAASLAAMMYANRMDSASPHGARHGTAYASGTGCAVTLDRWYKVRGATEAYLPSDFATDAGLSSLPLLPSVPDPVKGPDAPEGGTDPDGDGYSGIAFSISGLVTGVRDSVQRDWEQYATPLGHPVVSHGLQIVIPGTFESEEHVLHVSQCSDGCSLLASVSHAATDIAPYLTLAYIGASPSGSRVSQVVAATPRDALSTDLTTCANVRLMLPHDPNAPRN